MKCTFYGLAKNKSKEFYGKTKKFKFKASTAKTIR